MIGGVIVDPRPSVCRRFNAVCTKALATLLVKSSSLAQDGMIIILATETATAAYCLVLSTLVQFPYDFEVIRTV